MIRVLFICLGNICRSPMAEAVFRKMLRERHLESSVTVDSAGLGGWHAGDPPHQGTRQVLDDHGISYEGISSRQVRRDELKSYDYVIAMDEANMEGLARLGLSPSDNVTRLLELVPDVPEKDVPDPYYDNRFDYVYELVERGCRALLLRVEADLASK
ncbi:low molecular weight protein-tyrosine-phosphatase [Alicyclobacillus dauci]|uniref:protein-tyrosine-phosphatase n=1 Tax=Alicyclobacillus dauci TaxID=1475485 RepID=A0ABY6YZE4_9BACL|nr:low molecular weight protein-tyrosine-phosphatase [Alicyclobacillus dauci]WAH35997.1 low molecular weight phosphotyrosine protein phosphatase [Alicyclobacillus dauci]